jgi:hypothetical protein
MTGLKVTILNPGIGVIMDPGVIYGEMSPDNSATGGWVFVDSGWLLQNNEIRNDCSREAFLIKARMARPLGLDDDIVSVVRVMEYGMNMWECLLANMKDGMNWNDASDSIAATKDLLDFVRLIVPRVKRK